MIARRLARFVDDRLGGARFARSALAKVFPDHFSFMLGEVALYCFVVLVLTGIYLTFFFEPSTRESCTTATTRRSMGRRCRPRTVPPPGSASTCEPDW